MARCSIGSGLTSILRSVSKPSSTWRRDSGSRTPVAGHSAPPFPPLVSRVVRDPWPRPRPQGANGRGIHGARTPGRSGVRRAENSDDAGRASRIRLHETDCATRWSGSSCSVRRCAYDSGGRVQGLVGTGMDVTEEAELTTALRKSEGELRQMLDFAPQLIGVLGPQLEKLYANRVALAYYGVSLDERRQSLATGRPRPIRDAQHHKQQQRRKRHRAVSPSSAPRSRQSTRSRSQRRPTL